MSKALKAKKLEVEAAEELKPMRSDDYTESVYDIDESDYGKPKPAHWLFRRIFILSWIKDYDKEKAIADLIAGITLGLTIIPQSIAYAALAGLSSEYGLYTAFIGSIIYVFFGTIPQVSIGPTSLMSLLVLQFVGDRPIQFVIVLSFLAGLVELLMGVFQLGLIVSFIPSPVTKAFTTATAAIVALVQVKNLLGIKIKGIPSFLEFFQSIRLPDAIMGLTCLTLLLGLKQLSRLNLKKTTPIRRHITKFFWYISISRNALIVFFSALVAYNIAQYNSLEAVPFALSTKVESAKLTVHLPPFAFEYKNATYVFTDICSELGSGLIVVPIVAILANVAIAKAFVKDGKLDASQEMLTLGLCNLAGSFFSAMPTCGAFTRSAVSEASGVRTPMAGIYTGLIVLSALSVLTPYFQFIPKSALSAVLIAAVIFMIDVSNVKHFWHTNKKDFFSWIGCFIVCILAGVQMGLLFGIIVNMLFILLRLGNPKMGINLKKCDGVGYVHIVPRSDIYYAGVDYLRSEIVDACIQYRYEFAIVLDCTRFMQFDATFVEVITATAKELKENDVLLVLQNMSPKFQQLMPECSKLRYCDDVLTSDDLIYTKPKAPVLYQ